MQLTEQRAVAGAGRRSAAPAAPSCRRTLRLRVAAEAVASPPAAHQSSSAATTSSAAELAEIERLQRGDAFKELVALNDAAPKQSVNRPQKVRATEPRAGGFGLVDKGGPSLPPSSLSFPTPSGPSPSSPP